jgi:hypothetical protein
MNGPALLAAAAVLKQPLDGGQRALIGVGVVGEVGVGECGQGGGVYGNTNTGI